MPNFSPNRAAVPARRWRISQSVQDRLLFIHLDCTIISAASITVIITRKENFQHLVLCYIHILKSRFVLRLVVLCLHISMNYNNDYPSRAADDDVWVRLTIFIRNIRRGRVRAVIILIIIVNIPRAFTPARPTLTFNSLNFDRFAFGKSVSNYISTAKNFWKRAAFDHGQRNANVKEIIICSTIVSPVRSKKPAQGAYYT